MLEECQQTFFFRWGTLDKNMFIRTMSSLFLLTKPHSKSEYVVNKVYDAVTYTINRLLYCVDVNGRTSMALTTQASTTVVTFSTYANQFSTYANIYSTYANQFCNGGDQFSNPAN